MEARVRLRFNRVTRVSDDKVDDANPEHPHREAAQCSQYFHVTKKCVWQSQAEMFAGNNALQARSGGRLWPESALELQWQWSRCHD